MDRDGNTALHLCCLKAFDAGFSAIVEGRKKFLVDFGEEKDPVANQDCIDDLRLALQIMVMAWMTHYR